MSVCVRVSMCACVEQGHSKEALDTKSASVVARGVYTDSTATENQEAFFLPELYGETWDENVMSMSVGGCLLVGIWI